jgi:hypothetical protein
MPHLSESQLLELRDTNMTLRRIYGQVASVNEPSFEAACDQAASAKRVKVKSATYGPHSNRQQSMRTHKIEQHGPHDVPHNHNTGTLNSERDVFDKTTLCHHQLQPSSRQNTNTPSSTTQNTSHLVLHHAYLFLTSAGASQHDLRHTPSA